MTVTNADLDVHRQKKKKDLSSSLKQVLTCYSSLVHGEILLSTPWSDDAPHPAASTPKLWRFTVKALALILKVATLDGLLLARVQLPPCYTVQRQAPWTSPEPISSAQDETSEEGISPRFSV